MRTRLGGGLTSCNASQGRRPSRYFERSRETHAGNDQSGAVTLTRRRRIVAQIRRQPFFGGRNRLAGSRRVINHLITRDLPDPEIFRVGMREIETAPTRALMHGK